MSPTALLQVFRFAIVALTIGLIFTAGWTVKGWKDDSKRMAEVNLAREVKDAFLAHEAVVAQTLEAKLGKLTANRTIIEKHYEKIIENPVYRNVCLDPVGLRVLDAARRGEAPASSASDAVPPAP